MTTLTIRLPDDTAERLKSLAKSRGLSTNKLVEELSARALAAWDTENHFRAMAERIIGGRPRFSLHLAQGDAGCFR